MVTLCDRNRLTDSRTFAQQARVKISTLFRPPHFENSPNVAAFAAVLKLLHFTSDGSVFMSVHLLSCGSYKHLF